MKTYYQEPMERRASAPSHPYNYPSYPSSMFRSPPTSPDDKLFETSAPSSPTLSVSSFTAARKYRQDHDMDDDMNHPPLTLQERRLRNKQASAKYRQKKNQQQNDMRVMIGRLSEQNAVLERQLQELRLENERLKSTADKLRGKMVAKKMLKKWIGRQQQPFNYALSSGSEHDDGMNAVLATMANEHDDDDDDELESIDSQ